MDESVTQKLYDRALEAIGELYRDTSVSKEEAINNLDTLKDEIQILIEALKE
jgi:hypothetical protein